MGLVDPSCGLEVSENVGEFLIPDAKLTTKLVLPSWSGSEGDEDPFAQRANVVGSVLDHFEPDGSLFGDESQPERRCWCSETMLAGEDEITASSTQVEIRIAPGMEVGATSKRKARFVGGVLAGVMDEDDGKAESTRELAQGREHGRDLGGVILVDALKANVRVQDEQLGSVACEGLSKPVEMLFAVEPERRLEDELDVESVEVCSASTSDAVDALADLFRRVLGSIDEHTTALSDLETIETGSSGSDSDGDIESEPGLARFGSAADDADRALAPQAIDQPQGLFEPAWLKLCRLDDTKLSRCIHERLPERD
jgi:hypothetical protein